MKISIEIDSALMAKAKKLSGIQDESTLVGKALQLFVTIGNQKKLKYLWGKIELDEEAFK
ncbi:MAG TPA: hypothetical protein VK668_18890 [Mucilaginibacter sp.]|nr:hypothetical protein [Mucilaginibacter sp.]